MEDVIQATAFNAMNGLYLTPDMCFCATNVAAIELDVIVDRFHSKQPRNSDYEELADAVNDLFYVWKTKLPAPDRPSIGTWFGDLAMMTADLSTTYRLIRRGMYAALDLALAVHLRDTGIADDAPYRRVIPSGLENMHLGSIEDITVDTFLRILAVDPWQSWMERLRAQKQRSIQSLALAYADKMLTRGTEYILESLDNLAQSPSPLKALYIARRQARKSIRKSIKLFDRLGRTDDLRQFLNSASQATGGDAGPLLVNGRNYDYALLMRPGLLLSSTINCNSKMAPFGITVYNKQGNQLCGICAYFEHTPLLDNVLAIALSVQNERTEMEMLDAACVFDTSRWFYTDPVLPVLKGLPDPIMAPTLVDNIINYADSLSSDHNVLRTNMSKQKIPMAYNAFVHIMRPGKRYMSTMRRCAEYTHWEIMIGNEKARATLLDAQQALQNGEY